MGHRHGVDHVEVHQHREVRPNVDVMQETHWSLVDDHHGVGRDHHDVGRDHHDGRRGVGRVMDLHH